jgi:hypothetical protein
MGTVERGHELTGSSRTCEAAYMGVLRGATETLCNPHGRFNTMPTSIARADRPLCLQEIEPSHNNPLLLNIATAASAPTSRMAGMVYLLFWYRR